MGHVCAWGIYFAEVQELTKVNPYKIVPSSVPEAGANVSPVCVKASRLPSFTIFKVMGRGYFQQCRLNIRQKCGAPSILLKLSSCPPSPPAKTISPDCLCPKTRYSVFTLMKVREISGFQVQSFRLKIRRLSGPPPRISLGGNLNRRYTREK